MAFRPDNSRSLGRRRNARGFAARRDRRRRSAECDRIALSLAMRSAFGWHPHPASGRWAARPCRRPPRPKKGERQQVPPYRFSWLAFHTFCHTWATWMRMFGGADVQGLVSTGRWRNPRSAARYTQPLRTRNGIAPTYCRRVQNPWKGLSERKKRDDFNGLDPPKSWPQLFGPNQIR